MSKALKEALKMHNPNKRNPNKVKREKRQKRNLKEIAKGVALIERLDRIEAKKASKVGLAKLSKVEVALNKEKGINVPSEKVTSDKERKASVKEAFHNRHIEQLVIKSIKKRSKSVKSEKVKTPKVVVAKSVSLGDTPKVQKKVVRIHREVMPKVNRPKKSVAQINEENRLRLVALCNAHEAGLNSRINFYK